MVFKFLHILVSRRPRPAWTRGDYFNHSRLLCHITPGGLAKWRIGRTITWATAKYHREQKALGFHADRHFAKPLVMW